MIQKINQAQLLRLLQQQKKTLLELLLLPQYMKNVNIIIAVMAVFVTLIIMDRQNATAQIIIMEQTVKVGYFFSESLCNSKRSLLRDFDCLLSFHL
jgi:hypothetical protein